jgi:hypothetical protein
MAIKDFVPWLYTDDNGYAYVRRADKFMTDQVAALPATGGVGGATAVGHTPYTPMPRGLKPRHVVLYEASTGSRNKAVIYDNAAYIALVTGTSTLDWSDGDGTTHTGKVVDKIGEGPKGAIQRP